MTSNGGTGGFIANLNAEDITLENNFFDIGRTDQPYCRAVSGSVTGCTGVNASNNQQDYFFDDNSNAPLDVWRFNNVWDANVGDYPTLNPDSIDVTPLCEEAQVTATTVRAACEIQYSEDVDEEVTGEATWQARYRKASDSDWTYIDITDSNVGEMLFTGLDSDTDYQVGLKPSNSLFDDWLMIEVRTLEANSDSDADGVLDTEENASPNNGDANDDHILDSLQPNVITYLNPFSGHYAVLETNCESIAAFQVGGESSEAPDVGYSYPAGLVSFHITCENAGDTAQIRQYFYGIEGNDQYRVRKWMNDGSYKEIPGFELLGLPIENEVVFMIQYDITDGGEFDDDGEANGVVVDPSGLALSTTSSNSSNSLAGTGQNSAVFLVLAMILVATAALSYRKLQKTQ